jgi:hypothetical protein
MAADRLAPPQISKPLLDQEDEGGGEYNIWFHHKAGKRKRHVPERGVASKTRCVPDKHEGRTKGASGSDICLFFARGACHLGHRCNRRHRIPVYDDEVSMEIQRDCFGRMREATEGDDQNGPGSVLKENKTLFIGDVSPSTPNDVLRKAFEVFGPVVSIRFVRAKSIAFLEFQWRASAEFSKEALSQQVVGASTVSVRWAKEDPNPRRIAALAAERAAKVLRVVEDSSEVSMP